MAEKSNPLATLQNTKLPLWVSLLLLILLLVVFAWKQIAVSSVERQMEEQAAQLETTKAAIKAEAAAALAQQSEAAHRLLGSSLAWAIRGELIRNNLDQIDQYLNELVKNERIKLAVLSNQEGKILVASDKKYQDTDFSQAFPATILETAEVTILETEGAVKLMVMPIMGLNNRLGTAVLSYTPEQLPAAGK